MAQTTPVHVRIDRQNLLKLELLGAAAKPKKLNRSEMINVAVADYVDRHPAPASPPAAAKRRKQETAT